MFEARGDLNCLECPTFNVLIAVNLPTQFVLQRPYLYTTLGQLCTLIGLF